MSSVFAEEWAQACTDLNTEFGEDILITPMQASDGELQAASPDPSRPARTVTGVPTKAGATDRLGGTRRGTEFQGMSTMAVAPATVWFSAEVLTSLPYTLAQGDRITWLEKPGAPVFEIARPESSDLGDTTFILTRA